VAHFSELSTPRTGRATCRRPGTMERSTGAPHPPMLAPPRASNA